MKKFFLQRSVREQWLILIFSGMALTWWGISTVGHSSAHLQAWGASRAEQQTQALWLENRAAIMKRVATAGQALDPTKALDSAQSFAELNTMLQGLNAELGSQRTEKTEQFALHSVQVNIRQAGLPAILNFYRKLSARSPYLGIDQCVLTTDRSNSGLLNASLRIYSIEVITAAK